MDEKDKYKRTVLIALIACLLVIPTACGNRQNSLVEEELVESEDPSEFEMEEHTVGTSEIPVLEIEENIDMPRIYSFSEYIEKKPISIWFYIEDGTYSAPFGKDSTVSAVIIFQNDKV